MIHLKFFKIFIIFFNLNLILQMIMIQRHGNVNFQIQVVIRHNYEIFKGIIFFSNIVVWVPVNM